MHPTLHPDLFLGAYHAQDRELARWLEQHRVVSERTTAPSAAGGRLRRTVHAVRAAASDGRRRRTITARLAAGRLAVRSAAAHGRAATSATSSPAACCSPA